jgi:uncharacterized protein (DUF1697 family)
MPVWIALLRGINVGGKTSVSMALLKSDLEAWQLTNVQSCIQSGNLIFHSKKRSAKALAGKIAECVDKRHHFRPQMIVLSWAQLKAAVEANPFISETGDPKTVHFFFLQARPKSPKWDKLDKIKLPTETFQLIGTVFYLHAPEGIGKSKLATSLESCLGVVATGRNFRTVEKLKNMARQELDRV